MTDKKPTLGARVMSSGGVRFGLWAPKSTKVEILWASDEASLNHSKSVLMRPLEKGYHEVILDEARPGCLYKYRLESGKELPDPASKYQPFGPHGYSEVVASQFEWTDEAWQGVPLKEMVLYEVHVGTFSKEESFPGLERKLQHLKNLGINAIELMPVAQFPGHRNWGYDGVSLFAPQNTYGGDEKSPTALKRLINTCHRLGMAVILDVVYNHLGPEGNYLSEFGHYFQKKYTTPWGDALNFDGENSDEVRNFFLQNARQWLEEFHFDGLRLDAVHAILDTSAKPFLEELAELKESLAVSSGRSLYLIAESESNDSRILLSPKDGGLGMDAQWADDLHHLVHALITGERQGYYEDYGEMSQLSDIFDDGVIFKGDFSTFRQRSHGRSYDEVARNRLVVCSQNHDQIGNRKDGERLISMVGPEKQRLAAACVFLSPFLPLMFMGEELAETAPFLYFVDHTDEQLIDLVRQGRKAEFSSFRWQEEPPDPAALETFEKSKINWDRLEIDDLSKNFVSYYRQLIALSKWIRAHGLLETGFVKTDLLCDESVFQLVGQKSEQKIHILFSFSTETQWIELDDESLEIVLDSSEDALLKQNRIQPNKLELKPFSVIALKGKEE